MRLTFAIALAVATLWAGQAGAQAAWSVGWMRDNCVTAARLAGTEMKPEEAIASQICLTYMTGWRDTIGMHRTGDSPVDAYCLPENGDVTVLSAAFIVWARSHPERAEDYVALGLRDALLERFACQ